MYLELSNEDCSLPPRVPLDLRPASLCRATGGPAAFGAGYGRCVRAWPRRGLGLPQGSSRFDGQRLVLRPLAHGRVIDRKVGMAELVQQEGVQRGSDAAAAI